MSDPGEIPYHTLAVCNVVALMDAMVVTSPGTEHVTVVHALDEKEAVDEAITAAGMRIERIDNSRVKVFEAERQ